MAAAILSFTSSLFAAAPPVVSNVRASQRAGTQLVDVYYDLADPDSSSLTVSAAVSTNGGAAYFSPGASLSGALGTGIAPGSGKKITWNAGIDLPSKLFSNVRVSVTASDDTTPAGMGLIPAGSFTMGDSLDGHSSELPLHTVYVSAFYMDRYDVTKAQWDDVYNWAITHGYSVDYAGSGTAANHPVRTIDCLQSLVCYRGQQSEGRGAKREWAEIRAILYQRLGHTIPHAARIGIPPQHCCWPAAQAILPFPRK